MKEVSQEWLFKEAKNFLSQGEKVIIRMRGKSMNPYLREGKDRVVLSPYRPEELQIGAIVLFTYRDKYILHRIIGRKGDCFVTQGDGICKNTEIVQKQDIIAIVRTVIRPSGKEVSVRSWGGQAYWFCWRHIRLGRYLLWLLYKIRRIIILLFRYEN
jgi:signal peptidase I